MSTQSNICRIESAALRDLLAGADLVRLTRIIGATTPAAPIARPGTPAPGRVELRDLARPNTPLWMALRPLAQARHNGSSDNALLLNAKTVREIAYQLAGVSVPALPSVAAAPIMAQPKEFVWQRRKYWRISEFVFDTTLPPPPGCTGWDGAAGGKYQVVVGAIVENRRGSEFEAFWLVNAKGDRPPVVRDLSQVWMMREALARG